MSFQIVVNDIVLLKAIFHHLTVNHKNYFVDSVTDACPNHVEGVWNFSKRRNKVEDGTFRALL